MDLINPQIEKPTIEQLRGQWLLLAGQCQEALHAWRDAWLNYVDLDDTADRVAAREFQARCWTEYKAVSDQADRAWHDYDGAVDAREITPMTKDDVARLYDIPASLLD